MSDEKIRLLYYGDAPCVMTGFARVAREILLRLKYTGRYEILCLGINYYGDPHNLEGILKIFPVDQSNIYGTNKLLPIMAEFHPDVVFILNDYDAVPFYPEIYIRAQQAINRDILNVMYFPVDGEPFKDKDVQFIRRFIHRPLTYTKYAQDVIHKADPDGELVPYEYHGIDVNLFKPLPEKEMLEFKNQLGIDPNLFIVGNVGVNQLRKQQNMLMQAFAEFAKDKEDVALYLHCMKNTSYGWNLEELSRVLGIEKKVMFTHNINGPMGVPDSNMNIIYNLFDIAVYPIVAEGFGLPILESMSAGVPVIVHGVSSAPEVVGDAGLYIETQKICNGKGRKKEDLYYYFHHGDRSLKRPIPSISDMVEKMNMLYYDRALRKEFSEKGRERALSGLFSWDRLAHEIDKQIQQGLNSMKQSDSLDIEDIL